MIVKVVMKKPPSIVLMATRNCAQCWINVSDVGAALIHHYFCDVHTFCHRLGPLSWELLMADVGLRMMAHCLQRCSNIRSASQACCILAWWCCSLRLIWFACRRLPSFCIHFMPPLSGCGEMGHRWHKTHPSPLVTSSEIMETTKLSVAI